MKPTIDAHHHLWRYSASEYDWITDSMGAIRHDFLLPELETAMRAAGVDGTIAVQARQTLDETQWLLDMAQANSSVCGVVGWADLASDDFERQLDRLVQQPKLVGLRHVVQSEPDGFLDRPNFNRGLRSMLTTALCYDLLIVERQIEEAIRFVDRHPNQVFVLNHLAKPGIATGELEPWKTHLCKLARRQNVWCKVSGMVTEAVWNKWTPETLAPYFDVVVEAFGPQRLMAGSDWPVCLVACGYARWWDVLRSQFSGFSETERQAIFGGSAMQVYGLSPTERQ